MKVLALPRDENPYQGLLYAACARRGMRVRYVGELTPSHTLNLLLLPFELVAMRLAGWRFLHVHWLFAFGVTGTSRLPALRRLADAWFRLTLAVVRVSGLRLVWTAHNVLPHSPIFHDDLAARRELVEAADLVIAHSLASEREVGHVLGRPRRLAVIPQGPPGVSRHPVKKPPEAPRALLFFGKVLPYKGVEDLLVAFARVAGDTSLRLTVAGQCPDHELARRLAELAAPWPDRVRLRLENVPDQQVPDLLGRHDVLVLPFRRVTTSSSALLGLETGMPVVVPDLPAFEEMPVCRYEPGVAGLAACLLELAAADGAELERRGLAGRDWATRFSWDDVAESTCRAFGEAVVAH